MRKQVYTVAGVLVCAMMFTISTARAQSANQSVANIPFAFSAGAQKLPAGEYVVSVVNSSSDQKVLRIRSLDGRISTLLQTHSVQRQSQNDAKLIFHHYRNQYFLAQVWHAAESIGMEASKSRGERATERELSSRERTIESVSLTARR